MSVLRETEEIRGGKATERCHLRYGRKCFPCRDPSEGKDSGGVQIWRKHIPGLVAGRSVGV